MVLSRLFNEKHMILFFQYGIVLFSFTYLILFFVLALMRLPYPYHLEWLEGGVADHVLRILQGEEIYVSPSIDFITFIYTPLYYYVAAGFCLIFGFGLPTLRLVSLLAILGSFMVMFLLVRRETNSAYAALLSVGVFAATYHITGTWFDIARVDSLHLFFFLIGVYLLRLDQRHWTLIAASLAFALSFYTKQSILLPTVAVAGYTFFTSSRKHRWTLFTAMGVFFVLPFLWLQWKTSGWFWFYISLALHHPIVPENIVGFWASHMLSLFLPFAVAFLYFFKNRKQKDTMFFALFLASMVISSWLARLHSGGFWNVVLPAYLALSIVLGLGIEKAFRFVREDFGRIYTLGLLFLLQFSILYYSPISKLPTPEDRKVTEEYISLVADYESPVFASEFGGYYHYLLGKRSCFHAIALRDILLLKDNEHVLAFTEDMKLAFDEQEFSAVIVYESFRAVINNFFSMAANYSQKSVLQFSFERNIFTPHFEDGSGAFLPQLWYLYDPSSHMKNYGTT